MAQNKKKKTTSSARYTLIVFWATFLSSAFLTLISQLVIAELENALIPIILLIVVITCGIVFDIIGVSVTVANPATFNAKAARKIPGATKALFLLSRADKVANVCNDVVGDICGIVSGGLGAAIVFSLFAEGNLAASVTLTAFVSAFTVGGKSIGKRVAMGRPDTIIWFCARVFAAREILAKNGK